MFRLVAVGAFAIGALGIVAWLMAGVQAGQQRRTQRQLQHHGRRNCVGGNTVNCGASAAAPDAKP